MRLVFYFCLASLLLPLVFYAQEHTAIEDLLMEAKSKRHSQPEQAGKIAAYIISQDKNITTTAQATLLLANSFYVRGNYDEAVKQAIKAKRLADASTSLEIQLKSKLFAIYLLRELGLETVATAFLAEVQAATPNIDNDSLSVWLSGKLQQDHAYVAFSNGSLAEAKKALRKAQRRFLKVNSTVATIETSLLLGTVLVKNGELERAKSLLENTVKTTGTTEHVLFQHMKALQLLAHIFFLEKQYERSIRLYKEAYSISEQLSNPYSKNTCAEGLAMNYLALEDAQQFYAFKQQTNQLSVEVETDRDRAINSVYNLVNEYQAQRYNATINTAINWIYGLLGLLVLLLGAGIAIDFWYRSKTKQYEVIASYISPQKPGPALKKEEFILEKSSVVSEETERALLKKLNVFESGEKFTNPDMSIALLASQFDTNTKYLSEVINRHKGQNFNSYVNELRIDYIIEKLRTDPVYLNYKISYLAEESGFSSHSSFARVFKSVTGVSPTKFMEVFKKSKETV